MICREFLSDAVLHFSLLLLLGVRQSSLFSMAAWSELMLDDNSEMSVCVKCSAFALMSAYC